MNKPILFSISFPNLAKLYRGKVITEDDIIFQRGWECWIYICKRYSLWRH